MRHVPEIKLIRTDTTLDLSQKAEKVCFGRGRAGRQTGGRLAPPLLAGIHTHPQQKIFASVIFSPTQMAREAEPLACRRKKKLKKENTKQTTTTNASKEEYREATTTNREKRRLNLKRSLQQGSSNSVQYLVWF